VDTPKRGVPNHCCRPETLVAWMILFDPQNPSRAMVMPEALNPGS
jgi:hypothetical protein